ncbi:MAG: threonine synthase [Rhodothermales bacterium]
MAASWSLACSSCTTTHNASGLPTVCPSCGLPWLVRYADTPPPTLRAALATRPWTLWRYREWLPLTEAEHPVSLGEGITPLLRVPTVEQALGMQTVWVKDEGQNPCGSFKARGLSAAVTRASLDGATRFVLPTAGNAGVALAAYGTRAGLPVRVYAPQSTPATLLAQIRLFGADLHLIDGHIGDCGQAARAFAQETGASDISTLREPYRIEGKKTLGLELAEQFGWTLPDCIIYPTGGGTGLIGMWKAFHELRDAGWITGKLPRLFSVQSTGCAPVVKAFEEGATSTTPWPNPQTRASGLRVPNALGAHLILRAIRETGGHALAVTDDALGEASTRLAEQESIDACPEGGATLAALERLVADGVIRPDESVVLFNTGAGWLYR